VSSPGLPLGAASFEAVIPVERPELAVRAVPAVEDDAGLNILIGVIDSVRAPAVRTIVEEAAAFFALHHSATESTFQENRQLDRLRHVGASKRMGCMMDDGSRSA
jgi:hypothetical protein